MLSEQRTREGCLKRLEELIEIAQRNNLVGEGENKVMEEKDVQRIRKYINEVKPKPEKYETLANKLVSVADKIKEWVEKKDEKSLLWAKAIIIPTSSNYLFLQAEKAEEAGKSKEANELRGAAWISMKRAPSFEERGSNRRSIFGTVITQKDLFAYGSTSPEAIRIRGKKRSEKAMGTGLKKVFFVWPGGEKISAGDVKSRKEKAWKKKHKR